MKPYDKKDMEEQRQKKDKDKELRKQRIRHMLAEGLSSGIIAERLGLPKRIARCQLVRMSGFEP